MRTLTARPSLPHLIAGLLAMCFASTARAQVGAADDSLAFIRARCDSVAAALDAAPASAGPAWGPDFLPRCGVAGSQALARAARALRASTDRLRVENIFRNLSAAGDTAAVRAAQDVASDQAATPVARVYAVRSLLALSTDGFDIDAGWVLNGGPAGGCLPRMRSGAFPGSGLGATLRDEAFGTIAALASGSPPGAVQVAATCARLARR